MTLSTTKAQAKKEVRARFRDARRQHVASLDTATCALLFMRPPAAVVDAIPTEALIGLYHASPHEARTSGYAKFFLERGHTLALPRFSSSDAPMEFAVYKDPFEEADLEAGPFGTMQPTSDADAVIPGALFVPLIGFTAAGERLGQGGGHYDRWIARSRPPCVIGLAWDCQLAESLPCEVHDERMDAVITPTRMYGTMA